MTDEYHLSNLIIPKLSLLCIYYFVQGYTDINHINHHNQIIIIISGIVHEYLKSFF